MWDSSLVVKYFAELNLPQSLMGPHGVEQIRSRVWISACLTRNLAQMIANSMLKPLAFIVQLQPTVVETLGFISHSKDDLSSKNTEAGMQNAFRSDFLLMQAEFLLHCDFKEYIIWGVKLAPLPFQELPS